MALHFQDAGRKFLCIGRLWGPEGLGILGVVLLPFARFCPGVYPVVITARFLNSNNVGGSDGVGVLMLVWHMRGRKQ